VKNVLLARLMMIDLLSRHVPTAAWGNIRLVVRPSAETAPVVTWTMT
jgi:hypothetical protein